MGAHDLMDIYGQLSIIQHPLFADNKTLFKRVLADPVDRQQAGALLRLQQVLGPVMWRSSKAQAAAEHPLPHRTLALVELRLSAGEASFYDHIVKNISNLNAAKETATSWKIGENWRRARCCHFLSLGCVHSLIIFRCIFKITKSSVLGFLLILPFRRTYSFP